MGSHSGGFGRCAAFLFLMAAGAATAPALAAPPEGFLVDSVGGPFSSVVGVQPRPDGSLLAWERTGIVWHVLESGERATAPVLDIRDEVQGGGDQGLLSVVLDPAFPARPFLYALYAVDRHHLLYAGTDQYNPSASLYYKATIGRVTRYSLSEVGGALLADPESRLVLLGQTPSDGVPVLSLSHSVGEMVFGTDGTLLISTGDNANFGALDNGGAVHNPNVSDALAEGIIRPEEDVGAFRAQVVNSLCGKVLRISADDGAGVPGNPWFDPSEPRSPRSRVWALGLRNPYRMSIRAGTGSHNPSDANPGTLVIGDVGSYLAEEVNVVTRPGLNFGWPLFEGHRHNMQYWPLHAVHMLEGGASYPFRDLVLQDSLAAPEHIDSASVVQAESPSVSASSNALVQSSQGGYIGSGYRLVPSGAHLTWTANLPSEGSTTIAFRYSTAGTNPISVSVTAGGEPVASVPLALTGASTDWRIARFNVQASGKDVPIRISKLPSSTTLLIDCAWTESRSTQPSIPSSVPVFTHCRPILTWRSSGAMTPQYSSAGAAIAVTVGTEGGAEGASFDGACAVIGSVSTPDSWPDAYRGLLLGDYVSGWIRIGVVDWSSRCGADRITCSCTPTLTGVRLFDQGLTKIVSIHSAPEHDAVYVAQWDRIGRYRWLPGGSNPPAIHVTQSHEYGPSPLEVWFDASSTSDPDGDTFSVAWDFGDGSPPATGLTASHTFANGTGEPVGRTVRVTATDAHGVSSTRELHVGLDNTPPKVTIDSITDGQLYSALHGGNVPLEGTIEDDEHSPSDVTCEWQTILYHDTHNHPEPVDTQCSTVTTLQATGCEPHATYWYVITLTARDSGGLSATALVRLDPDCNEPAGCDADLTDDSLVDSVDLSFLLAGWGSDGQTDIDGNGTTDAGDLSILLTQWGDCTSG
jgi:glucose/arabinose dehydrogenase